VLDGHAAEALSFARSLKTEAPSTPGAEAQAAGVRLTIASLAEHSLAHRREATEALDDLQRNHAAGFAFQVASVHAWRDESDQAFEWLERAYSQRDGGMAMIKYDPFITRLRADPRYAALVRKLGLPE